MSNQKNEKTKLIPTSEISVSDFSEDVPGVTQLLTPNLASLRKKENAEAIHLESPTPSGNAGASPPKLSLPEKRTEARTSKNPNPLKDFGILYHLLFVEEGGALRYQGVMEIGDSPFAKWRHSFFHQMKIDLRILGISVSFQEFAADRFPLQKEAFGMDPEEFLQCVRDPVDLKKMHVFISKKSLLGKKNEIEGVLSGAPAASEPGSGEIKIELEF